MSNELSITTNIGIEVYFQLLNNTGQFWNTLSGAFQSYIASGAGYYDIPASGVVSGSQVYQASMPAAAAGVYSVIGRQLLTSGTPKETDTVIGVGQIQWDGSNEVPLISRASSGQVAALPTSGIVNDKLNTIMNSGVLSSQLDTKALSGSVAFLSGAVAGIMNSGTLNDKLNTLPNSGTLANITLSGHPLDSIATSGQVAVLPISGIVYGMFTNDMPEGYPASGKVGSLYQATQIVKQRQGEAFISGLTLTVFQIDKITAAQTFTINNSGNPTSITRAT